MQSIQPPRTDHPLPSLTLYDAYGPLFIWAASSSEWTSIVQEEALDAAGPIGENAKSAGIRSMVAFGITASLLGISLAALSWGAVNLTKSAITQTQTLGQESSLPNP